MTPSLVPEGLLLTVADLHALVVGGEPGKHAHGR